MRIDSLADVQELHRAFAIALRESTEAMMARDAPTLEAVLDSKQEVLARLKERLRAATEARDEAVRRYNEEIEQSERAIAQVEEELRANKQEFERMAQEDAEGDAAATKRRPEASGRARRRGTRAPAEPTRETAQPE